MGLRRFCSTLAAVALVAGGSFIPFEVGADPSEFEPQASSQDPDYLAGKTAVEKGNWNEALKRFGQAAQRDPQNADIHNYLGYTYRKLEQMELAFKHYKQALALNPFHRGAHEYIGEAYLMVNDLQSAEKHLAALREICRLPCEELGDLDRAVKSYRAKPGL